MPIGKDSITKRVAKQTEPAEIAPAKEEKIAPELVATTAAAPTEKKAPAKKTTSTAKKTSSSTSTTKKTTATTAKKPATPKAEDVKEAPATKEAPVIETAVLANVSPETVAAVIGHKEDAKYEKVQIGQKMPDFLL
jgi:hypothetical protein